MRFNGYNTTVTRESRKVREEEYVYEPYNGLSVVSAVYLELGGSQVVGTQVLSESAGGGSSTVGNPELI
jgi:hypothetical protein